MSYIYTYDFAELHKYEIRGGMIFSVHLGQT